MKSGRFYSILLVLVCCFIITPFASAQENNPFMDGLMSIIQESIDDFIGTYKGSLGDVKLIERLGNKVVLEVTYDNVKRSDNVYVQGEVRYLGTSLEGFSNTLNSVSGSHGKVKLTIGWSREEDDGWGTVSSEVKSDQIRLFLVRKSNPDRPFGEIIYDISKTWTNSDEPDVESMTAENDGIELEDGESAPDIKPQPNIFVKPGTILLPHAQLVTPPASAKIPPKTATQPLIQTAAPLSITKARQPVHIVSNYDFYGNAKSALWRSAAGTLPFPGSDNDRKGFARLISKGRLNSGNAAGMMLETHPQWKSGGWIEGRFPLMILGDHLKFKSIAGFLQGADKTDGVTFQVYLMENNKSYRVASHRVSSRKYVTIAADLSKWANKKVQIVLRVRAGKTCDQDWAVWVKPRLSK